MCIHWVNLGGYGASGAVVCQYRSLNKRTAKNRVFRPVPVTYDIHI